MSSVLLSVMSLPCWPWPKFVWNELITFGLQHQKTLLGNGNCDKFSLKVKKTRCAALVGWAEIQIESISLYLYVILDNMSHCKL